MHIETTLSSVYNANILSLLKAVLIIIKGLIYLKDCLSASLENVENPQDLHRHVKTHLKPSYHCTKCGHVTFQKRLLKRHQVTHKDEYKYVCTYCTFKTKYAWSMVRHDKTCKGQNKM